MDIRHASRHRILDRDHGIFRIARFHHAQGIFKCRAAQGLHVGIGVMTGRMRVRTQFSLESYFLIIRVGQGLPGEKFSPSLEIRELKTRGPLRVRSTEQHTRPLKVGGSIDADRHSVNEANVDAHSRFERAQLFKLFAHFKP